MKSSRLHRSAEAEFLKSVRYYEDQQKGLGADFIEAFVEARDRLTADPETGQQTGISNCFSLQLRRFPFRIVYKEVDDLIWIVAVAHASRRPEYWKNRRLNR